MKNTAKLTYSESSKRDALVNRVNRSNRQWEIVTVGIASDAEIVRHNGIREMLHVAARHMDGLG
jgi:hypothetical protein